MAEESARRRAFVVALAGALLSTTGAVWLGAQSLGTVLRWSGGAGVLLAAFGLYLLLRTVRQVVSRADARALTRTGIMTLALLLLGFVETLRGLLGGWRSVQAVDVPVDPGLMAEALAQASATTQLACYLALPVSLLCLLGLRRAKGRERDAGRLPARSAGP